MAWMSISPLWGRAPISNAWQTGRYLGHPIFEYNIIQVLQRPKKLKTCSKKISMKNLNIKEKLTKTKSSSRRFLIEIQKRTKSPGSMILRTLENALFSDFSSYSFNRCREDSTICSYCFKLFLFSKLLDDTLSYFLSLRVQIDC